MPRSKYLIVGGGMTADAAVNGIREIDPVGSIAIVGAEAVTPYDRPPLTKGLWKGKPDDSVWRHTEKKSVEFHLGRRVIGIDLQRKEAVDDRQGAFQFEKLLLATGGRPRRLPFGEEQIIYYRTLTDYHRLRYQADRNGGFAVIGGGFIASEIAAALALNQQKVTMIFPGKGICARLFPDELSAYLNQFYRQKGVDVLTGQTVTGLELRSRALILKTSTGTELSVAGILAGLGIEPNVELARAVGLKVDNGIVVNEFLQTSAPDVFAAGDVAAFYNPALDKVLRVEHEDNANTMGRCAGRNMAGKPEPYHHLPFFYSDLFELGYEAVGELDSRLETFTDWKTPFKEGVIYYLRAGRVRGVLLWNVWERVDAARKLIAAPGPFSAKDLKGRLS